VLSVNGVQYSGNNTVPRPSIPPSTSPLDKIKDPANGIVALGYGDYAVFELQFRCTHAAEGVSITTFEFQPLLDIAALFLICGKLKDSVNPQSPLQGAPQSPPDSSGIVSVPFDHDSIQAYYADYLRDGPLAHMNTHYVDSRLGETPLECLREDELALKRLKEIEESLGPGAARKGRDIIAKLLRGVPAISNFPSM